MHAIPEKVPAGRYGYRPGCDSGRTLDPGRGAGRRLIANIGNFHTLAFRLGPSGIEGVFEHHTGLLDLLKLEGLLLALADGSLSHQTVFDDHGHGALVIVRTTRDSRKVKPEVLWGSGHRSTAQFDGKISH